MADIQEAIESAVEHAQEDDKLGTIVAGSVALTATFLAISNVKSGNVVQGMAKAQVAANNQWSYYQSKSTKEIVATGLVAQLEVQRDTSPGLSVESRAVLDNRIAKYTAETKRYEKEKGEIKAKAEELEKEYDRLNVKDDQFDISEASLSVAIALFGITVLTKKRWLLTVAFAWAGFGLLIGLAGFIGWSIRPEWFAKLLG